MASHPHGNQPAFLPPTTSQAWAQTFSAPSFSTPTATNTPFPAFQYNTFADLRIPPGKGLNNSEGGAFADPAAQTFSFSTAKLPPDFSPGSPASQRFNSFDNPPTSSQYATFAAPSTSWTLPTPQPAPLTATSSTFFELPFERTPLASPAPTALEVPKTHTQMRALIVTPSSNICQDFYYRHYCSCNDVTSDMSKHPPSELVCPIGYLSTCSSPYCSCQHPNTAVIEALKSEIRFEQSILEHMGLANSDERRPVVNLRIRTLRAVLCTNTMCSSSTCDLQHVSGDAREKLIKDNELGTPETVTKICYPESQLYQQVKSLVDDANAKTPNYNLKISNLKEITNNKLVERFEATKNSLKASLGGAEPEILSFMLHGSPQASNIGRQGFDISYTQNSLHGRGHYFTDSAKAATIWARAKTTKSGPVTILVCDVLKDRAQRVDLASADITGSTYYTIVADSTAILPRLILTCKIEPKGAS